MGNRWNVDLYRDGACVYQVDGNGDIVSTVGWARNHIAAVTIFEYMCQHEPMSGFEIRVKSRVISHRPPAPGAPSPLLE